MSIESVVDSSSKSSKLAAQPPQVPKDLADLASSTGQPPKIRVNVKHNLNGCVSVSSAQLMEEIKETTAEAAPAAAPAAEKGDKGTEGALGAEGKEGDAKEGDKSEEEAAAAAAAQEAKSSEEPPKKKRFKKVELKVTASTVGMSQVWGGRIGKGRGKDGGGVMVWRLRVMHAG